MGVDEGWQLMVAKRQPPSVRILNWVTLHHLWLAAALVFIVSFLARLPNLSPGIDQGDAVLYKNSLDDMHFYREAQWPLLLLFQKGLWTLLPHHTPQSVMSLSSLIFAAGTLMIFFVLVYKFTKSYIASVGLALLLFFIPLFGVYSVVNMQDMAQAFFVMAFIAAAVKFCYSLTSRWLYAAASVAGLALGVRMTLVLVLPGLVLVMLLSKGLKYKNYLKASGAYLLGAVVGLSGDFFIPPLANSSAKSFFVGLFHMFNPTVLGYWKKAGGYTLMSGYKHTIYYWAPMLWLIIYFMAKRQKKQNSLAPITALGASLVSLAIAYGLSIALKAVNAGSPGYRIFVVQLILIGGLFIYELAKLLKSVYKERNHKWLDAREKSIALIATVIVCFIVFNYAAVAGSTRYALIILAPVLLLAVLLANRTGWRSWPLVIGLIAFNLWGCSFAQSQAYVSVYKQLDTRSATALFARDHPGRYYNFEATGSVLGYFQTYGSADRIYGPPTGWCESVDFNYQNYAIFYGDASVNKKIVQDCPRASFTQAARFQRNENIIEDSVGNQGFTIYRLSMSQN